MDNRSLAEWDLIIRQARRADLLARLGLAAQQCGIWDAIPDRPRAHLEAALILAEKHRRDIQWEVRCIRQAFAGSGITVILLKGAAYLIAGLPSAIGRTFSDVDILVPQARLAEAEAILIRHGWIDMKASAYDQRFYRDWMHELPPLYNVERGSVIDVHHTITTPLGRIRVNAEHLFTDSRSIESGLSVLSPADMILHSALHLFGDSQSLRALRDLDDIHRLLLHFGQTKGFFATLLARAQLLGAESTLLRALRAVRDQLGMTLPAPLQAHLAATPSPWRDRLVDLAYHQILCPAHPACRSRWTGWAEAFLYVRAHYLKLPLHLLLPHLLRKAILRPPPEE